MRCRTTCNTRFRLAGSAFAGRESNPLARAGGFLRHPFPLVGTSTLVGSLNESSYLMLKGQAQSLPTDQGDQSLTGKHAAFLHRYACRLDIRRLPHDPFATVLSQS